MQPLHSIFTTLLFLIFLTTTVNAEELRLGTTLSLTGPYATYGRQALQGIQKAIAEKNSEGGVNGKEVKLFVEDFGTLDLRAALSGARKLIDIEKVDVFLPLIVEDSEVIVPITSQKPLFSMVVGCGSRKCGFNLGPYNVRASSSHDEIIKALVGYAKDQSVAHSCILASESTYFQEYGDYIKELTLKSGEKVTYETVPLSNSGDYRDIATKYSRSDCDAVYSWIPMGSAGVFFRRLRENGYKGLILSIVETDDPGVLKSAGASAEGVVFARFALGSNDFVQSYKQKYNEMPSRPAIPSYDGVRLLLELIEQVGTDPDALKSSFIKVKNKSATNGVMTYTDEGERLGENIELMMIRNGEAKRIN